MPVPDPRRRFAEFLAAHKLRATSTRRHVVEAVEAAPGHFDAETLRLRLKKQGKRLSRATIYRTLSLLQGSGVLRRVQLADGALRYELARPGDPRHLLICRRCGGVEEVLDQALSRGLSEVARRAGFEPEEESVRLRGVCGRCRGTRPSRGPVGANKPK